MRARLGDRPLPGPCALVLASLVLACGPGVSPPAGESTTGTTTSTIDGTGTTTGLGTSTLGDGSTTTGGESTGGETSGSSSGSTDTGLGLGRDCDILVQDCAEGLKCTVIDPFSELRWACVPVAEDPVGTGEACVVEELGSGLDNCGVGAVCFDIDPRTLEGTCFDYCMGGRPDPTCEDPDTFCHIPGDASYGMWCFEVCDPRQPSCAPDQICTDFSGSGAFSCSPVFMGGGAAVAEPCEFNYECDAGLACMGSSQVPGCAGPAGSSCCSSFCTVGDDTPCLPGQQCVPWFDEFLPHPSFEDLGVCAA